FSKRERISLRVKAYQSKEVLIYDQDKKSYTTSIMLVYKIVDVAKAFYEIDHMEAYLDVHCEMILRRSLANNVAQQLFDNRELMHETTLDIEDQLISRLEMAGVELLEMQLIVVPNKWKEDELLVLLNQLVQTLEKKSYFKLM